MSETMMSSRQQTRLSMTVIAEELSGLHAGVVHLREVYGEAAASSDLTFIKMLEDKYAGLTEEFAKLVDIVAVMLADLNDTE